MPDISHLGWPWDGTWDDYYDALLIECEWEAYYGKDDDD